MSGVAHKRSLQLAPEGSGSDAAAAAHGGGAQRQRLLMAALTEGQGAQPHYGRHVQATPARLPHRCLEVGPGPPFVSLQNSLTSRLASAPALLAC